MSHELGPLPEPDGHITDGHRDGLMFVRGRLDELTALVSSTAPMFTAHQMRAYTLAEVAKAVEAERLDAERYRKIRAQSHAMTPRITVPFEPYQTYTPAGLDAALDALPATPTATAQNQPAPAPPQAP